MGNLRDEILIGSSEETVESLGEVLVFFLEPEANESLSRGDGDSAFLFLFHPNV